MRQSLPIVGVLLAFFLGRETAADKQDEKDPRFDRLVVQELVIGKSIQVGPSMEGKAAQILRISPSEIRFESAEVGDNGEIVAVGIWQVDGVRIIARSNDSYQSVDLACNRLRITDHRQRTHVFLELDQVGLIGPNGEARLVRAKGERGLVVTDLNADKEARVSAIGLVTRKLK